MAKKAFAVLNRVLFGEGRKQTMLKAGDTIELDPEDPTQAATVAELVARDFIEDPANPKTRTPDEKAALEKRQAAGVGLTHAPASQIRGEQAIAARTRRIEEGILEPDADDERRARSRVAAAEIEAAEQSGVRAGRFAAGREQEARSRREP